MKNMRKRKLYALFLLTAAVLSSCTDDFTANGEWQEIPVVYCVLDQDEDTTYVRVQKCFLGSGDQRNYMGIKDSIYYPTDALDVVLEEWTSWTDSKGLMHKSGNEAVKRYDFVCSTVSAKQEGDFVSGEVPIYKCCTKGCLDSTKMYRLVVKKRVGGDTVATAETPLVYGEYHLERPNSARMFDFSGSGRDKFCEMMWYAMKNARRYQVRVKFKYNDFIDTVYASGVRDTIRTPHEFDIAGPVVKSSMKTSERYVSTNLSHQQFLGVIKDNLKDSKTPKVAADSVGIFIDCCTEDLAAYMYAASPTGSFNTESFTYTNVKGGLGVVASRRTHLVTSVPVRTDATSNYRKALRDLGINMN